MSLLNVSELKSKLIVYFIGASVTIFCPSWFNNTPIYGIDVVNDDLCFDVPNVPNKINSKESGGNLLFLGKSFIAFKEALGYKESRGNYHVTSSFGYLGKYQFSINTLKLMGVTSSKDFLSDTELQERAFLNYTSRNKWILRADLERFVGKKIRGIEITESGVLAAAHLAGAGNVKKFLRRKGAFRFRDGFGTTIESYLLRFSGFDTEVIPAQENWVDILTMSSID